MARRPDLETYQRKRRFAVTAEPDGAAPGAQAPTPAGHGPIFVVQKHAARRLHYDLRLEINGALRSWAVPEGPSLDPKARRLAVATEDHPLAYAGFEGTIPKGEYGGGAVIVWDRGTWVSMADDPIAALGAGELKFRLKGQKLRGGWTLVRLKDKDAKNWLLIKERDDEVRPQADYDVLAAAPASALSGRTVEEVAAAADQAPKPAPTRSRVQPARLACAVRAALPERFAPQLASAAAASPEGPGWVHEIKYDGYRTIARVEGGVARLLTRNQHDWTHRYGALAAAFARLPCKSALIDGEIAVQDARGVTVLDLLEEALAAGRTQALTFFAFDLMHLDGYDLTACRLTDRKRALAGLLAGIDDPAFPIVYSDHIEGAGAQLFAHACRMGLEGVMAKRADAPYAQGRTKTWLKVKSAYVADFPVVGFTTTAPGQAAALLLAEPGADGALAFVGRVGSGLGEAQARAAYAMLADKTVARPVVAAPRIANARWTTPAATATVAFHARSTEGMVRQASLLSLAPLQPAATAPARPRLVTDRDLAAIRLTNPKREMFEGSGVTKLDIAVYYARVGDWMLGDLLHRPVSLIRCTTGKLADCFFQRHAFAGLPEGVGRISLSSDEGRGDFIYIESAKGFLGLTQFGVVEFHPWAARIDAPEHPDRFILDLDPDPDLPWASVAAGARQLRERLEQLGFTPFVRTTGGKGLHLVMALAPGTDWPALRAFAEAVAKAAAADAPRLFTATAAKAKRTGRIFIDYLRNGRGATAAASYSLRANPRFTVAAPVAWAELATIPGPGAFDRKNTPQRLLHLGKDPWEGLQESAAAITPRARAAVGLK